MIYVRYSSPDVSLNLAAEYYFASEKNFDEDVFMLWCPRPTIVVGNFQNIHEEVDTAYATSRGIDIVRRLSGGGTVYQDGGSVQFAFIEKRQGDIDFRRYLEPICALLREIGIDAEINGRNDITVDGKKISGNSQYHVSGRTVHHGTLLFSADIDEMARAVTLPDYKISSKGIKSVRSRVANMCDYTDAIKSSEELMEYLARRVANGREYIPCEEDLVRIERIADEKFREERRGGLASRSPKFNFERVCRLNGGNMIINLQVAGGVIAASEIRGDFFSSCDVSILTASLKGTAFTANAVREAVLSSGFYTYGSSCEEIAERLSSVIG